MLTAKVFIMSNDKNMKTFKKSQTYGSEQNWQVCRKDRKLIEKEMRTHSDFSVQDEVIDDLISLFEKLGYLVIEDPDE